MLRKKISFPYVIHIILYIFFIIFAFLMDSPYNIIIGLYKIILNSDILITDYIHLAGIGATFVNIGILGLVCIFLFIYTNSVITGRTFIGLWLLTGFGMFGKNFLNVWPIMFGVWLYSKFKRKQFSDYILTAILGTSLAPTVSLFYFFPGMHFILGLIVGSLVGILIGFILPPISNHCFSAHRGFNLYNVGFAGGVLATMVMSLLRAVGHNFDTRSIWHSGTDTLFAILLIGISIYFILCSLLVKKSLKLILADFKAINKLNGKFPTDFFVDFDSSCYFNMGVLGIFSTIFVLIIDGDLNGPTIGGIFTMIGFGCFGKNIMNVIPVMIGAFLSASINILEFNSPAMVVSIMFSTGLAPISGYYGWKYGIIAGFLHVFMVSNIGYMHGGLNLYNNGLACGFVAMLMIPVIESLKENSNTYV